MIAKPKFDPRKMMEMAVDVMEKSIAERRKDGKKSPLVGAVLVKPDGEVETAYRGELREGDHAEFTLLERKNRDSKLDGAVLFATLEPCAPGARKHPKLGCAERIVNARIKEVWVGIEDPDPTVDRKGIKFLQDNGVAVEMFNRDLQERIKQANQEFIAQALERKAATEDEPARKILLSTLESPVENSDLSDFSRDVLADYRKLSKIKEPVGSPAFNRRLAQLGLLEPKGKRMFPSGFGILLFGNAPREVMQQAGLLGTIHHPDGSEEVKDFDGPMVLVPEQAIQWLKGKLPNPIDRSGAKRKDSYDLFYEQVREGIVNALVHRDYAIKGAKCQLIVRPDVITILSPGAPVEPITLDQLQSFEAPMLSRNPPLHYVFAKMELAEERGLGLKSMRSRSADIGLPLPTYSFKNPYLTLTLYRRAEGAIKALDKSIVGQLTKEEQDGWSFLATRTGLTQSEYAKELGVTARTAQRHLGHFVELGLLRRVGQGPATKYVKL